MTQEIKFTEHCNGGCSIYATHINSSFKDQITPTIKHSAECYEGRLREAAYEAAVQKDQSKKLDEKLKQQGISLGLYQRSLRRHESTVDTCNARIDDAFPHLKGQRLPEKVDKLILLAKDRDQIGEQMEATCNMAQEEAEMLRNNITNAEKELAAVVSEIEAVRPGSPHRPHVFIRSVLKECTAINNENARRGTLLARVRSVLNEF